MLQDDGRRRALRAEVAEKRAGVLAVQPIAEKIEAWHSRAALLDARLNRAVQRQQPLADLIPAIEELALVVEAEMATWRSSLRGNDVTGRVSDAERGARLIEQTMQALRSRAYQSL